MPGVGVLRRGTGSAGPGHVEFAAFKLLGHMRRDRAKSTEQSLDLAFEDLVLASGSVGIAAEGASIVVGGAIVAGVGGIGQTFAFDLLATTRIAGYHDSSSLLGLGVGSTRFVIGISFGGGCCGGSLGSRGSFWTLFG